MCMGGGAEDFSKRGLGGCLWVHSSGPKICSTEIDHNYQEHIEVVLALHDFFGSFQIFFNNCSLLKKIITGKNYFFQT